MEQWTKGAWILAYVKGALTEPPTKVSHVEPTDSDADYVRGFDAGMDYAQALIALAEEAWNDREQGVAFYQD